MWETPVACFDRRYAAMNSTPLQPGRRERLLPFVTFKVDRRLGIWSYRLAYAHW